MDLEQKPFFYIMCLHDKVGAELVWIRVQKLRSEKLFFFRPDKLQVKSKFLYDVIYVLWATG